MSIRTHVGRVGEAFRNNPPPPQKKYKKWTQSYHVIDAVYLHAVARVSMVKAFFQKAPFAAVVHHCSSVSESSCAVVNVQNVSIVYDSTHSSRSRLILARPLFCLAQNFVHLCLGAPIANGWPPCILLVVPHIFESLARHL